MIGRNYKGPLTKHRFTLNKKNSGPHGFREEDFFMFPTLSLWVPMTSRAWPIWTLALCLVDLCRVPPNIATKQNIHAFRLAPVYNVNF